MSSAKWSSEEETDLDLNWEEFHAAHPKRSYEAWARKRRRERSRKTWGAKVAPVVVAGKLEEPEYSDDELWERMVAYQEMVQARQREAFRLEHTVRIDTQVPIAVAFPSDWHIGSVHTDHKKLKADCELMESHPRLYCALGGDPVDNFIEPEKVDAAREQIAQVSEQWQLFRRRVKGLVDTNTLLWVSGGNHDQWTRRLSGIDGIGAALSGIPVVNTQEGGFIFLEVGNQTYTIYRKHRPTRGKSSKNILNFLKSMLFEHLPIEFDVGISEHLHQPDFEVVEYRPGTKMDRVLIACGSYKVKDPYAESLGYYGGGYGVPTVIFRPDRREILPFRSIGAALEALDGVSYATAA